MRGCERKFREAALDAAEHLVAGLELRDTRADRADLAGRFIAAQLLRPAMHRAADHQFAAVERRRVYLDHHFACSGCWHRDVAPFEHGGVVFSDDPA